MSGDLLEQRGPIPFLDIGQQWTPLTGPQGPAGPSTIGVPTSRTVALGTAYQATNTARPAIITVTVTGTASITLSGGTTVSADLVIGSTSAVASGTGTVIGKYINTLSGAVIVGVGINNVQTLTFSFVLPIGWWFAVRNTGGSPSIVSAFDQQIG